MSDLKNKALEYHKEKNGKLGTDLLTKLNTKEDLSLAYSPGVGFPCLEIQKNPDDAYEYTSKGHTVAIISNGTAVLGFGDLGAMASKPVMEGKAALLKKFANIDGVDIEIESKDKDEIITVIKNIGITWGGINLEDIKAPECFEIEEKLQELLDIPVFHDDQHGTAIVSLAALINAIEIQGKKKEDLEIVVNGAGAAAIASMKLLKKYGFKNIVMCDTKGVIYKGRTEGMNKYKEEFAIETDKRSLSEAVSGVDVFFGLSAKGMLTKEMVSSMAEKPIIFAMANPDPEITPSEVHEVRDDAIVATGRSDYPNQVNNFLCFPYLFRGLLDVRSKKVTDDVKIVIAETLAKITKMEVPSYLKSIYPNETLKFGKDYIIPKGFDKRLPIFICPEVAKIAMELGLSRINIDLQKYKTSLTEEFEEI